MLKRDALDTYLDRLASVAMIVAAVALVWVVVGTVKLTLNGQALPLMGR